SCEPRLRTDDRLDHLGRPIVSDGSRLGPGPQAVGLIRADLPIGDADLGVATGIVNLVAHDPGDAGVEAVLQVLVTMKPDPDGARIGVLTVGMLPDDPALAVPEVEGMPPAVEVAVARPARHQFQDGRVATTVGGRGVPQAVRAAVVVLIHGP